MKKPVQLQAIERFSVGGNRPGGCCWQERLAAILNIVSTFPSANHVLGEKPVLLLLHTYALIDTIPSTIIRAHGGPC
jgi:hypothetical protein